MRAKQVTIGEKLYTFAPDPKLYRDEVRKTFRAIGKLKNVVLTGSKTATPVSTDRMRSRCKIWVDGAFAEVEFRGSSGDRPITVTARIAVASRVVGSSIAVPHDISVPDIAREILGDALAKLEG